MITSPQYLQQHCILYRHSPPGARFTKYLMIFLRLSCDQSQVCRKFSICDVVWFILQL